MQLSAAMVITSYCLTLEKIIFHIFIILIYILEECIKKMKMRWIKNNAVHGATNIKIWTMEHFLLQSTVSAKLPSKSARITCARALGISTPIVSQGKGCRPEPCC